MMRRAAKNHRSTGATLLVVLALVTVVSILLLAYLGTVQFERAATQNYSGELTADQIAKGGLDREIADLDQEIRAGSTALTGTLTTSPVYYRPVNPLSMVPARYSDTGLPYTNVIRVSASNSTYYNAAYSSTVYTPGMVPANLAVASATTNLSPDGRYISAARWQAPQLLLSTETAPGVMPVPDWILMTRSGPTNAAGIAFGSSGDTLNNQSSSNPNYVVGRYAFIVYNEGGLLDATVAGAPNSGATGAPGADNSGNRGSLALAALTNSVFTPAQINALAIWRNAASDTSETVYTNYIYSIQSTNGFLQVQPGDNTFLSRQDLIAYANYTGAMSALPYLGTFNRSVNAPAYIPNLNPSAPTYTTDQSVNLEPLSVRFSKGGTINSGGTRLKSRTVQQGDFLLTRRFPLSRLSWVGYNGPANGATAYDVWRAFGLVWNSSGYCWNYVSAKGASMPVVYNPATTVCSSIKTLAQVAAENPPRDPDFFELLQAGILNGSLGQTGGPQFTTSNNGVNLFGGSGDTSGYDSVQMYHIIQIGVNMIDQARADNYPTAIEVNPDVQGRDLWTAKGVAGTTASSTSSPRVFYGVKNLPYINRIVDTYVRWTTPPSPYLNSDAVPALPFLGSTTYRQPYVGCWQQFELWNPHQSIPNTTAGYPAAIRIAASGRIHGDIYSRPFTSSSNRVDELTYQPGEKYPKNPGETAWDFSTNYIEMTAASSTNFYEPRMVSPNYVSAATPNNAQDGSATAGSGVGGANGTPFAGMYVGSAYVPDYNYCAGGVTNVFPFVTPSVTSDTNCLTYNVARINPFVSAPKAAYGVTYQMEYRDPVNSTIWHPYGLVKNVGFEADSNFLPSSTGTTTWTALNSNAVARFNQKIDPRTDRFSMSKGAGGDTDVNLVNAAPAVNDTMRPIKTGSGHSADAAIPYTTNTLIPATYPTTWTGIPPPTAVQNTVYYLGSVSENTTTSIVYYNDPDGKLRRGDSAYNSSFNSDGHPGIANTDSSFGSTGNLARPIFLNRPFRSVGELGYVDRDLPWKTLDFFTKDSGDAALLDLFSVSDADVVAGTIDLNTRNVQALAEALGGGAINPYHVSDTVAAPLSASQATSLAGVFTTATATRPLQSRGEMVTAALDPATGETILSNGVYTTQSAKIQREAAVRALAEVGNARTWNLLIDIIAQSGKYPPSLGPGSSYDNFIPDGEKRFWLHVAIDRYTGKVVDRYLEPVQE